MMTYENDYTKIVPFGCGHDYESAEYEAQSIEKCTLLQDEDVHYGEVRYLQETNNDLSFEGTK